MTSLTAPISDDQPFGVFLKGERQIYRGLRNAFNAAQTSWRKMTETPDAIEDSENIAANAAAWGALSEQCATCLTETSKDLEILSWYVAAQLHGPEPLENCRDAMTGLVELVEQSIDQLQPILPEAKLRGDTEEARAAEIAELRLRPFVQLFGEVEGTGLINGPLTNMPAIGEVTLGKYVLADKDGTLDTLRAEVAARIGSEGAALTEKIENLQALAELITRLDTAVKAYARTHSQTPPSIGYGSRLVTELLHAIETLVEGLGFPWPGREAEADVAEPAPAETSAAPARQAPTTAAPAAGGSFNPGTNVANRQDALRAIAQLATYFRTTEPHSPICLLLDRAVRWGNLSAGELYREILSNGSTGMAQMALMTGLESQGFADKFGGPGAGAAGGVEHPTLDNYAAAVPVPTATQPVLAQTPTAAPTAAPVPAPSVPAASASVAPAAAPSTHASPAPAVEAAEPTSQTPGEEPAVEDFQW